MVVDVVEENRAEFAVEFICTQLQVAASSYDAARKRRTAPSARAVRDAVMMQVLLTLWVANRKVYGAHKLWKAARRVGHDIGRDQVARLMLQLGIEGVCRLRKKVFTTRQDPGRRQGPGPGQPALHGRPARRLVGERPDLRPDRSGMAYVCVIVDAFSQRIVGWPVAANMKTERVLDALEMARRARGSHRLVGLVAHSDAGSQFTSVRFTERLEEIGVTQSMGAVGTCLLTG